MPLSIFLRPRQPRLLSSIPRLLLLLTLSASAQSPHERSMVASDQAELKRALDAYDQGDLPTAEPLLVDLAHRYTGNFEANEALGTLYVESGNLPASLEYLKHASTLAPTQAIAHANLGAAYLKSNMAPEAITELRTAAKSDPANANTQSNLGQAFMLNADFSNASKAFQAAVEAAPDDPALKYNLALALFNSGSTPEAGKILAEIPPTAASDQTEALAGDIAERTGNYPEAIAHLQSAARLNPSDANLYALSLELLRHWTWDEALKIAQFGSAHYPASTHFQLAEGIAHYGAAQYPAAASIFSTLLAKDPDNPLYADLLGRTCNFVSEDTGTDCNGLADFARRHPQNAQAATYAAASLLHRPTAQQDADLISHLLTQAIAADPRLADAWFQLAVFDQYRLQWQESATALERSIELRPTFPDAHYRLARAYSHLGRKDDAQQQMLLHQKYSQQEKDTLNARLQEMVIFLVKSN